MIRWFSDWRAILSILNFLSLTFLFYSFMPSIYTANDNYTSNYTCTANMRQKFHSFLFWSTYKLRVRRLANGDRSVILTQMQCLKRGTIEPRRFLLQSHQIQGPISVVYFSSNLKRFSIQSFLLMWLKWWKTWGEGGDKEKCKSSRKLKRCVNSLIFLKYY